MHRGQHPETPILRAEEKSPGGAEHLEDGSVFRRPVHYDPAKRTKGGPTPLPPPDATLMRRLYPNMPLRPPFRLEAGFPNREDIVLRDIRDSQAFLALSDSGRALTLKVHLAAGTHGVALDYCRAPFRDRAHRARVREILLPLWRDLSTSPTKLAALLGLQRRRLYRLMGVR
jgi:hypothetical protein